jgi:hypothetical protein
MAKAQIGTIVRVVSGGLVPPRNSRAGEGESEVKKGSRQLPKVSFNVSPVSCREAPGNGALALAQRQDTGLLDETETRTGQRKTRMVRGASWRIVSRNGTGSQEQGGLPE